MSAAVTVPPGLFTRTTSARTSLSPAAFCSSSRTRASSETRGGWAPGARPGLRSSSVRKPETSRSRIFARPPPSTTSSSSGRIRGVRSSLMSEQPARVVASARTSAVRMGRVYRRRAGGGATAIIGTLVTGSNALTLEDVQAAARRLAGRIHRTPVVASDAVDEACGFGVFLKCENLQRAGSFKIRGALNKLLALDAAARARGVVAYSSGNHAQGVALAARLLGTSAIICMPKDAPAGKLAATRALGAEVVFYDRLTGEP